MPNRNNETVTGVVAALLLGMPQKQTLPNGRVWTSAIHKEPTGDSILLAGENFAGDYQANRKYHGGPDKAVCGYCAAHYPYWQAIYGEEFVYGAFGENITVDGLTEVNLCIGDTFRLGEAVVQISQPRQPCANVSKRWNAPKLPKQMEDSGKTGFYLRRIEAGRVRAGDGFVLMARPNPDWDLDRCNRAMYNDTAIAERTALRAVPLLSAEWQRILGRKLNGDGD